MSSFLVSIHAFCHDDDAVFSFTFSIAVLFYGSSVGEENYVSKLFGSSFEALADHFLHLRDVIFDCSRESCLAKVVEVCRKFMKKNSGNLLAIFRNQFMRFGKLSLIFSQRKVPCCHLVELVNFRG